MRLARRLVVSGIATSLGALLIAPSGAQEPKTAEYIFIAAESPKAVNLKTGAVEQVIDWAYQGPPDDCPPNAFWGNYKEMAVLTRCGSGEEYKLEDAGPVPAMASAYVAYMVPVGPGSGTDDPGPSVDPEFSPRGMKP